MLPERVKRYVLLSMEGAPSVMSGLLAKYPSSDPLWDKRFDPERFTLREAIAHIADWDEIFLQRLQRTVSEDNPTLPDLDEGQLATDRDYSRQDPQQNLQRFARNRAALVEYLRSLDDTALARPALRPELGVMTAETQMVMIVGHDGYHTRQAAEYTAG